jgi:hypothetical protein
MTSVIRANIWQNGLGVKYGTVLNVASTTTLDVASATNNDLVFITHNIVRSSATHPIIVTGHCSWCGDNPNGYFRLERSFNNSTWSIIHKIAEYDERPYTLGEIGNLNFNHFDNPGTTGAQVWYRVQFIHNVRNGGTMFRNRPFTDAAWSTVDGRCSTAITLMEVQV